MKDTPPRSSPPLRSCEQRGRDTLQHAPDEVLLGFARAVRAAGVPVTPDRSRAYLEACALVGVASASVTRAAGHATLCASPDDLERHDRVFEEWFRADLADPAGAPTRRQAPARSVLPDVDESDGGAAEAEDEDDPLRAAASRVEILRHRDVATLDQADRARLAVLLSALEVRLPARAVRRRMPHRRGGVDAGRTLRASLRRMGEPALIHRRDRIVRPRRVVFLVDVSGSMSGYTEVQLRVAHRYVVASASGAGTAEVFSVGTRLTHLTRALRHRDPERALAAAGKVVPDWSGGTRLGETLQAFTDRWGRRGMARGAVVVILSDGWERGDPALLGEQVARLRRLAHRVIWVNPHRGKQGYLPIQGGIAAVLGHLDHFLAGHSLATYTDLGTVIADA